ncbi:hypothetical protein [Nocardia sp. NPDC057030]|uniref:hypothetical protein n=1 Tax=unclassified Nocardia TaxID=2637762 RepID=UPI00362A39DD
MNHHDAFPHDEPDEHPRFAAYLSELEQINEAEEIALAMKVLADPDQAMAQSAVLRHIDRRAANLHPRPAYEPWAESMTRATSRFPILARRLQEWTLFRAITLSRPWHPDALLESSDWLQHKTAAGSNTDALAILAERGRTKRIRNTARANPKHPRSH